MFSECYSDLLANLALGEYLQSEYDIARCSYKLLDSALFVAHKDYVRRQIVYSLLQVRGLPYLFRAWLSRDRKMLPIPSTS